MKPGHPNGMSHQAVKPIRELVFLCYLILACGGCSTIHTGPLLGPIPTGIPERGTLKEGALYQDPKGRFTALAPEGNLKPNRMPYGVILNSRGELPGATSYLVFAWDKPTDLRPGESALTRTVQGLPLSLEQQGTKMQVVRQEPVTYRGFPAIDLDFFLTNVKKGRVDRRYVSRLIETEAFVYWVYYSRAILGEPAINEFHRSQAERFFEGITFLSPASSPGS